MAIPPQQLMQGACAQLKYHVRDSRFGVNICAEDANNVGVTQTKKHVGLFLQKTRTLPPDNCGPCTEMADITCGVFNENTQSVATT
jgi:hypothetical protein